MKKINAELGEFESEFDLVCELLETQGRKPLIKKYGTLAKSSKKTAQGRIDIFVGFHLREWKKTLERDSSKYTSPVKVAHRDLMRCLPFHDENNKIKVLEKKLHNFFSSASVDAGVPKDVFKGFADALNLSLIQTFLLFLEFCERENREIQDLPPDRLRQTIFDIHQYLENFEENESAEDKDLPPDNRNFLWQGGQCRFEDTPVSHYLSNPNNSQNQSLDNISSILSYDNRLTTFIGRDEEFEILKDWLKTSPSKSIKLIHGEGGIGKSRLASYFAEKAAALGWSAGFVEPLEHGVWEAGQKGILFIIDHPEQQPDKVKDFLQVIRNHSDSSKSIKIILISRNLDFLQQVSSVVDNLSMSNMALRPMAQDEDIAWKLFQDAWFGLNKLLKNRDGEKKPFTINSETFSSWLEKDLSNNGKPLTIIALAYYLFIEPESANVDILMLSTPKIIRYFSEREATLIIHEVKKHVKANPHLAAELEPQGVCLLKAVAAITGDMDAVTVRRVSDDTKFLNVDYFPPKYKHLRELSLLEDNKLLAITPDILAADFFSYSLENFAVGQEAEWCIAAIGLEDTNGDQIYSNYRALGKILYDNRWQNYADQIVDSICSFISNKPYYSEWVVTKLIEKIDLPHVMHPIVIQSIATTLDTTDSIQLEARCYSLCGFYAESLPPDESITFVYKASQLYREIIEQKDHYDVYDHNNLAVTLLDLGNAYAKFHEYEKAYKFTEEARSLFQEICKFQADWDKTPLAVVTMNLAHRAFNLNRREQSILLINEALEQFDELARIKSKDMRPYIAKCLGFLAIFLASSGNINQETVNIGEEALHIYEYLYEESREHFAFPYMAILREQAARLHSVNMIHRALILNLKALNILNYAATSALHNYNQILNQTIGETITILFDYTHLQDCNSKDVEVAFNTCLNSIGRTPSASSIKLVEHIKSFYLALKEIKNPQLTDYATRVAKDVDKLQAEI